jgi:CRP-like cAMP-binding protein
MLEQTIPRDPIQKRTDGATARIKSVCVAYQIDEDFLRNVLRNVPAIAHSKHELINVGMSSAIQRYESLFIAIAHPIQQDLVTDLGSRVHPLSFDVMSFLFIVQAGKAISSKIFADLPGSSRTRWRPRRAAAPRGTHQSSVRMKSTEEQARAY